MSDHVDERPRPSLPTLPGPPGRQRTDRDPGSPPTVTSPDLVPTSAPTPVAPTPVAPTPVPPPVIGPSPAGLSPSGSAPPRSSLPTRPAPPTWPGRIIGLVLLLVVLAGGAFGVWAFVQRIDTSTTTTSPGGDRDRVGSTDPDPDGLIETGVQAIQDVQALVLPTGDVPPPLFRTATVSQTTVRREAAADGSTSERSFTITDELDDQQRTAKVSLSSGEEYLVDGAAVYRPGEVFGAPWTRHAHDGTETPWLSADTILLAPDVLPGSTTAMSNLTSVQESVRGVTVTTYRFELSDPTWFSDHFDAEVPAATLQAAFDRVGGVRFLVSVDAAGLVRVADQDARAVLDAIGAATADGSLVVARRYELVSIGDGPPSYQLPAEVVDGEAWTTPILDEARRAVGAGEADADPAG